MMLCWRTGAGGQSGGEECFLLLSRYVQQLLIKPSFPIRAEMQTLVLLIIRYTFCSSHEINSICNKNG